MKSTHIKIFLFWLVVLNWPPVLIGIPFLCLLCFLPFLFWINIPALWLGLGRCIGPPHYEIGAFGALPQTPLAWIGVAAFWTLLAVVLTIGISFLFHIPRTIELRRRARKGYCLTCGYNLTGNISGVCPECGTKITSENDDR